MSADLSLIIPLFNERDRVTASATEVARYAAERDGSTQVIWSDDGSTDSTVEILQELLDSHPAVDTKVVRNPHRGKGAAVRSGLAHASHRIWAFCDADLSTPMSELERLVTIAALSREPAFVIGSRGLPNSNLQRRQSRLRESLGRGFNLAAQRLLVPGIRDTQCGAKAADRELWSVLLPWSQEDGFAWDVEMVALALRAGVEVKEIAVTWAHNDRSKVSVLRDGVTMTMALGRISTRLRSMPRSEARFPQPAPRSNPGAR